MNFKKKEEKKLVKQSAFFCIIQKNQQSLNSNCHSRKQTSEKKIPLLHAVHAPRLLNIYYVYTTAIAWILHTFGYSIWFWKSCIKKKVSYSISAPPKFDVAHAGPVTGRTGETLELVCEAAGDDHIK